MKNLGVPEIAKYRDLEADRLYQTKDNERGLGGAFIVPTPGSRASPGPMRRRAFMRVIASSGADQVAPYRWDHVSVSLSDRCPTWEEMDFVKRLFFKPEEVCFQLHVSDVEHISNHPYCLHIWRPLDVGIPRPPADTVGIPGLAKVG